MLWANVIEKEEERTMYEYKVEVYRVKDSEKEMNALAQYGWRVVAVTANECLHWTVKDTIIVTYERSK